MLGMLLPPIGLETPISKYAVNCAFEVPELGMIQLDFKGGIKVRVESSTQSGLGGVKL